MARIKLMRAPLKYVQGENALYQFYAETKDLGKRFLFICSNSGHKSCHAKIEKSFENTDCSRIYEVFGGVSSVGEIEKMRSIVKQNNIEVVVGVGGGSAIDTAKATAFYEHVPVVIVPTVCATDAPCTGLSVIYNDDGTFNSYLFYPRNPEAVIVDSKVIANAPAKFLVAGMGDALATYFEARACVRTDAPSLENGGVSRSATALCKLCYETLLEYGAQAKIACEQKLLTPALEAVIEANTYLSGVGADNGGLAVAHSVYNGFTALQECDATMHGSIVAFGTITQLILEAAPKHEINEVMDFCHSVGLPLTLKELGVTDNSRVMIAAEKACASGETIHNMVGDVTPEQLYSALLTADMLGKEYLKQHN
ncbi:glycerol dehydrogenase [Hydrogenoanaerobacterium saccharovorans]|uniref:Glycerol dehydrogenase n=1 Tax=Hydrogenoanaerobacterium saccharovorans TaxID=474960 RepID=A0A1H8EGI5_9FIRM|nr:glycerol dehydrogenase [Hydrogenoanaerobacterium saccharovorans]RPF42134.1 glycerol dehydrogenase [Hydrogenoanaerobacterium saccharovorans]SEN18234.1 glycerol dehydrogenase [Hydrogenoanaerobacterium saccharovorans]